MDHMTLVYCVHHISRALEELSFAATDHIGSNKGAESHRAHCAATARRNLLQAAELLEPKPDTE